MQNNQESLIRKRSNIYIYIYTPTENCDFFNRKTTYTYTLYKVRINKSDACRKI